MRTTLTAVYRMTEALGALCLALVGVMTLSQVIGRLFDFQVASADEMAGYFMAASGFLLLGPSLNNGVHIRVGILVERLHGGPRRLLEIVCLGAALFFVGYLAWYWAVVAWDSFDLGEMSQGLLAIPLWIPQATMEFGLIVLTIALIDNLAAVLAGGEAAYNTAGPATEG
ncbi:MAG: TRAP transporter small permease subunit [Azospirillum sp.]|nr:TRAP transporter small permease subunit [Azospirillum sp.]